MKQSLRHDARIEELVDLLNSKGFPAESSDDVPDNLRAGKSEHRNASLWMIQPQANAWSDPVANAYGQPLPSLFRSLVDRYAFLGFELGPLSFFDNTGDSTRPDEFTRRVLADKGLLDVSVPNGLVHFAQPYSTNYDPVCFDTKRRGGGPIVQIDHEQILCNNRLRIVKELVPSFRSLVENEIHRLKSATATV